MDIRITHRTQPAQSCDYSIHSSVVLALAIIGHLKGLLTEVKLVFGSKIAQLEVEKPENVEQVC